MPAGTYPLPPVYAGSKAQSSQGTSIWVQTVASPVTWVYIGECLNAKFGDKAMFEDSSNLASTAKEFLPVLPDPGKLNVTINRVSTDAGQAALQASKVAGSRLPYSVVLPINTQAGQTTTGDTRTFSAYVEELTPQIETNKKITSGFTLQLTGPITDTVGS